MHGKFFTALFVVLLGTVQSQGADGQAPLPSGARVRLGTLDFLAGSAVSAIAFSPDSKTVIWQGVDDGSHFNLRHWDLATSKQLHRFIGDDFGDRPQEFSVFRVIGPDSLLRTSANGLALMDLNTGIERVVTEVARGKPSWLSPDGKHILTYSTQGDWRKRTAAATLTLWNVDRSERVREFTHDFRDAPAEATAGARLADVAFSPDGANFATSWITLAHGPMLVQRVGQIVSFWDVATGQEQPLDADAGYTLHFLEGGKVLACGDGRHAGGARSTSDLDYGLMEFWDVTTRRKLNSVTGPVDWSRPLAFSPDGRLFASGGGSDERAVMVWQTATGKLARKFTGHHAKVQQLTFSPDGQMLASGIDDTLFHEQKDSPSLAESILIWDVRELQQ